MVEDLKNTVRCHGCRHYFVTYDRYQPYGCAIFGFKTKSLPAQVVVESSWHAMCIPGRPPKRKGGL